MKLLVYSHDTFGLGNIRRMSAICEYLLETIPNLSILLISGSPVLHRFRFPQKLDYIKLPCVGRDTTGELSVKYWETDIHDIIQLRANLILSATVDFKPDLILVDKKPYGIQNELQPTLKYIKSSGLNSKIVLLLRDILDHPTKTQEEWENAGNYQAIYDYYDRVLVVGCTEIFDAIKEYNFPHNIAKKVKFCGYIRRHAGHQSVAKTQEILNMKSQEKLVVVTSGGGEDGANLINTYLRGLASLSGSQSFKSLVITGTELSAHQKQEIFTFAKSLPQVIVEEFVDDLNSYFNAADLIVSMGGYNTVCEILSLNKKAIIVPRIKPVQEQLIRVQKMSELGFFKMIHPDKLNPNFLIEMLIEQLQSVAETPSLNLEGLPEISRSILTLFYTKILSNSTNYNSSFNSLSLQRLKVS